MTCHETMTCHEMDADDPSNPDIDAPIPLVPSRRAELEIRRAELDKQITGYDVGDRPMSPPVRYLRELAEIDTELAAMEE